MPIIPDPKRRISPLRNDAPADEAFVLRQIYYVFDYILDVNPSRVGGKVAIEKCASEIWRRAQAYERLHDVVLMRDSPYFKFAAKVGSIYNRVVTLGCDKVDVAKSVLRDPSLFYKNIDKMTERYWGHADRLSQYYVMPRQFAQLTLDWPNIYSYPEDTLNYRFSLCLALTETPLFKLRGIDKLTFEQRRDYILVKRPMMMGKGPENYLIRLVHAELNGEKSMSSSAIVRGPRLPFERQVVEALGHNPDKAVIDVTRSTQKAVKIDEIKGGLSQFVGILTGDLLRNPTDSTHRRGLSLVNTLLPEGGLPTRRAKKLLLLRMVELKFLKAYTTSP